MIEMNDREEEAGRTCRKKQWKPIRIEWIAREFRIFGGYSNRRRGRLKCNRTRLCIQMIAIRTRKARESTKTTLTVLLYLTKREKKRE